MLIFNNFKLIWTVVLFNFIIVVLSYDYLQDTNDDNYFFEESGDDDYDYISFNTRIVGGSVADINDYSYQVSLQMNGFGGSYSFCGGSLISMRHVLTAAHCVYLKSSQGQSVLIKSTDFWVLAGTPDSRNTNPPGQKRFVQQSFYHENYMNFDSDIAVLKLTRPFDQQTTITPIEMKMGSSPTDLSCVVSGWGTLSSNGQIPRYLMKVELPIMDHDTCKMAYGQVITDNMICAGYPEGLKDSCQGDSGGPLRCENLLAGVVSFGNGCAAKDFPGVYTEVAKFIPWINRYTSDQYCNYMDVNTSQYDENEIAGAELIVPYQTTMLRLHLSKYVPFCQGTIISSKHILTSAHCVFIYTNDGKFTMLNHGDIKIVVGVSDLKNPTAYLHLDKIAVHEDYSNVIKRNDLAILYIAGEIITSSTVSPIDLRTLPLSNDENCLVIGKTANNLECKFSRYTKVMNAIVADTESCKKSYANDIHVLDNKVCANIADTTCEGDAIGILVCSNKLSGIFSYTFGCADTNYPGVYTDILPYTNWIENKIYSGQGINKINFNIIVASSTIVFLCTYINLLQ